MEVWEDGAGWAWDDPDLPAELAEYAEHDAECRNPDCDPREDQT